MEDVDPKALPPIWPINPVRMLVDNGVYDFRYVPLTSIAMVTSRTIKVLSLYPVNPTYLTRIQVDFNLIVYDSRISRMEEAKILLLELVHEWISEGSIPEIEWSGLVRTLEFLDTLRTRSELISHLPSFSCRLCDDFEEHVSFEMHPCGDY